MADSKVAKTTITPPNIEPGKNINLLAKLVYWFIGLLIGPNKNATFDQAETAIIIMGVGALTGIISSPIMIMAHVNKNEVKLMLSSQKTGFGGPSKVSKDITGITMAIPIGK